MQAMVKIILFSQRSDGDGDTDKKILPLHARWTHPLNPSKSDAPLLIDAFAIMGKRVRLVKALIYFRGRDDVPSNKIGDDDVMRIFFRPKF